MPVLTEQFGRYRILKKLGAGGMGEVYLAHDGQMDRHVALKIPQLEGREAERVLEQFYREARIVARIRHPGVCPIYDVGAIDGIHFLTMAFIEGESLDKVIRQRGRKPIHEAVELVQRVAEALQQLHAQGIVHRDLKPANVMIQTDGVPVLLDFGLARSLSAQSQAMGSQTAATGTPAYMAPEQVAGQAVQIKAWTDVYSLGVMLFELLTGRLPFEALNTVHYAMQVMQAERPRPSALVPGIPAALDNLCVAMLAIDPAKRPPTMQEVSARLQAVRTAPADVSVRCPHCTKKVRLTSSMAGKKVLCPGCKQRLDEPPASQTMPLESSLNQTLPTSVGPGLPTVTFVASSETYARVRLLTRLAMGLYAATAGLSMILVLLAENIDYNFVINVFLALCIGLCYLPLGITAYYTRTSLRTAGCLLGAAVGLAVIGLPILLWDLYGDHPVKLRGAWVFFWSVIILICSLVFVAGLLLLKVVRRLRGWKRPD